MKKKDEHKEAEKGLFAMGQVGTALTPPTPLPHRPIPQLSVFTVHGKTFTFKELDEIVLNESSLSFNYRAMSDSRYKHATFFVANLAGFSKTY